MGEIPNSYKVLVRKPEGKRPPGRPRRTLLKCLSKKLNIKV